MAIYWKKCLQDIQINFYTALNSQGNLSKEALYTIQEDSKRTFTYSTSFSASDMNQILKKTLISLVNYLSIEYYQGMNCIMGALFASGFNQP